MLLLDGRQVNAGKHAVATAIIDGNIEELFYAKSCEATATKTKTEIKTLGRTGSQHKVGGWNGTGSFTIYYITSLFRRMMKQYAKTGKDIYFTLSVTNEDPTSNSGKQTVILYECNIDATTLTKFDVDSDALDESFDFTFDDFDLPEEFNY